MAITGDLLGANGGGRGRHGVLAAPAAAALALDATAGGVPSLLAKLACALERARAAPLAA